MKFKVANKFITSLNKVFKTGYKNPAVGKTCRCTAFSNVRCNAIVGEYPNYKIDMARVLMSHGILPVAESVGVRAAADNKLLFSWGNNTNVGIAKATDKVIVAVYSINKCSCLYTVGEATRKQLTVDFDARLFAGDTVETYIGFISANEKYIADSVYLGQVTVAA